MLYNIFVSERLSFINGNYKAVTCCLITEFGALAKMKNRSHHACVAAYAVASRLFKNEDIIFTFHIV